MLIINNTTTPAPNVHVFNDLDKMVRLYIDSGNGNARKLNSLTPIEFVAFVYSICTGSFNVTGFDSKAFYTYFLTSSKESSLPLRVVNHLSYTKEEFIKRGFCLMTR